MQNKNKINDYGAVLDQKYGKPGTDERNAFDEEAYAFYTGQILLDARKEAKMTQQEVADALQVSKSYISRIENGIIMPSVATFYKIVNVLGLRVDLVKLA